MDGEGIVLGLLVFGPALVGLLALALGVWLVASYKGRDDLQGGAGTGGSQVWKLVIGGTCLVAALGIGGCYGVMFLGAGLR
ncbi:MAG: hypothetical protein AAF447_07840 [Myxococcota bacterium]